MENNENFVLNKSALNKGQRNLLKYLIYFCRKYGTETVANTKEFREKYIKVLSANSIKQEDNTVSKYFEDLKNKGFIIVHPKYEKKYYKVNIEYILNDKSF